MLLVRINKSSETCDIYDLEKAEHIFVSKKMLVINIGPNSYTIPYYKDPERKLSDDKFAELRTVLLGKNTNAVIMLDDIIRDEKQ